MRAYGQIQTCFWSSQDILGLSATAKLLAAYLLTSPHSNCLGCYRAPVQYISVDLSMPVETLLEGFVELIQNGFAMVDEDLGWVFLPQFLKWNPIANPNVGKKLFSELQMVPENFKYYNELIDSIAEYGEHLPKGFETVSKRFRDRSETVSEPFLNKEPEPEPEPKPDTPPISPPAGGTIVTKRFVLPSVEEVAAYCQMRHNGIDPQQFVDFYACKGWMVGKNKMTDWQAAIRNWERGESRRGQQQKRLAGGLVI